MKRLIFLALITLWCISITGNVSYGIYGLTCEQLENPIGIDRSTPCFSWKLQSTHRGTFQAAYRILVATSEELLDETQADIWDSGKIMSDCSVLVPFKGRELVSATTYYWKVRSWNEKGEASAWSEPAVFTTGILKDEDWGKAKWIAFEKDMKLIVPAIHSPLVKQELKNEKTGMYRLPQFRKVFSVSKEVK